MTTATTTKQADSVRRVQELRRSSAATPRPSGKVYRRRAKHRARVTS